MQCAAACSSVLLAVMAAKTASRTHEHAAAHCMADNLWCRACHAHQDAALGGTAGALSSVLLLSWLQIVLSGD